MASSRPRRTRGAKKPRRDPARRVSRRKVLSAAGGVAAAAMAAPHAIAGEPTTDDPNWKVKQGRINQSVVHWCFEPMPVEELAQAAAAMGLKSLELVGPEHWPILKKHGLVCAITPTHTFVRGLNHKEHHAECIEKLTQAIDATAAARWPNVITFSGMREGLSDAEGIANMVSGLKQVLPLAEKKRVNICLEPLNTRVDIEMKGHPGYHCDRVEWAVEVCDRLGSPRMKILFDIYHTQIMQGDLIARIRKYKDYIAHYHTAGVPGRGDLDEPQEINYPAVMQTIAETGYQGYVGQEFIPAGSDKIARLRRAVRLCDV